MSPLEQIALAWQAAFRSLRELRHPALWAPWVLLGTLQAALLAAIWNFAHPAFSSVMAPLVGWLGGEGALHYPGLFRALPSIYGTANLVVGALAGSVAVGAATQLFADRFRGRTASAAAALAESCRRSLDLIGAQLPFHLVALAFAYGFGGWLDSQRRSLFVRGLGFVTVVAGSLLAQSLFFYVAALVMLERRSALSALRELPRTWTRGLWAAIFLGLLLLATLLPFDWLEGRSGVLVTRGRPELVGALTLAEIGVTLIVWSVLAGSATLVYLAAMAREPEERR